MHGPDSIVTMHGPDSIVTMHASESKLQQLELAHTDQQTLEDIKHSNALATTSTEIEKGYFVSSRVIGTILGLSLGITVSYWGFSPPAAALQAINADIGPSSNASLFSIIWTISCAVGTLLFGRLSDKFGRRWFVLGGSAIGIIGAIIAATAKRMNTLIAANVFLGLSAGVHTCYGITIGEVVPNKWKFVGNAVASSTEILSNGFGAYLGLRLAHKYSWRYIYYIYIPCMCFALLLQFLFYRPPTFRQLHGSRTVREELRRVDYIGIILVVIGTVLFLLGVSWGGQPLPWTSPTILSLLVVGGSIMIVFVFWEIYGKQPNPIVPMYFFKDLRGFVSATIICCVAATTWLGLAIIWPSQVIRFYSSTDTSWQQAAWLSTTLAFGGWTGGVFWSPMITIVKHTRYQLIFFVAFMVAFTGSLASCSSSNRGRSAAFSFLAGIPSALLQIFTVLLIQMETNDIDLGTVYAVMFFIRGLAGSIMTPVYLAILSSKTSSMLRKYVPRAVIRSGLPESSVDYLLKVVAAGGNTIQLQTVPGMTPAVEEALGPAITDAYAAAYPYIYYAAVAVGIVGLGASICMREYDQYFTDHVPRQIYRSNDRRENHPDSYDMKKDPSNVNSGQETWVETQTATEQA